MIFVTSSWWQVVEATTQQRNGGFCAFGLCGLVWLLTATNEAHSGVLLQHWLTAWVMVSSSYQYVTLVMSPFLYQLHLLLFNMLHLSTAQTCVYVDISSEISLRSQSSASLARSNISCPPYFSVLPHFLVWCHSCPLNSIWGIWNVASV